jgi:hypothetical protein
MLDLRKNNFNGIVETVVNPGSDLTDRKGLVVSARPSFYRGVSR